MQSLVPIGFVGIYVVTLGIATFLEKPAMRSLDAYQINLLTAVGIVVAAALAMLLRDHAVPALEPTLAGLGIGALIGIGTIFYFLGLEHLPVSVAATVANTYIVVTVVLSFFFLHDSITIPKVAGIILTLAGVTLLAYHA